MLDLAIRRGLLVDGTGAPAQRADIGIEGDRIAVIGTVPEAHREVDAEGRVVAPGFVDPHSHSDWTLHANRDAQSTIRQGVTTEIVGNCGIGNAPVTDRSVAEVSARLAAYGYDGPLSWRSFGEYLADVEAGGTSQNLGFLVGHSTLREAAGVTGQQTPDEAALSLMGDLAREAMESGALGMSSGLEYSLGAFAPTSEVSRMAEIVGRYGGIYASHVRNRDARILDSIEEFLTIARAGDLPGQISHLNVRHDTNAPERAWERAVELMVAARARGQDIQADTTPFPQGIGLMTGILPPWLLAEGNERAAAALADPRVRDRVRGDCDRYWRFIYKGQWHRVRLQHSPQFPELDGRTFVDIAEIRKQDPWDSFFDILSAAGPAMGELTMLGDLFTDKHLAEMISHPLFSLGVDTYSSVDHGPLSQITCNPLPYSGHVFYLTHHVREKETLSLEEAVRKMSAMPANRFGLHGRGLLRERFFADLVVFDFDRLSSDSNFATPSVYPQGIDLVAVNGEVVVDGGGHTGARPGRVLRRKQ